MRGRFLAGVSVEFHRLVSEDLHDLHRDVQLVEVEESSCDFMICCRESGPPSTFTIVRVETILVHREKDGISHRVGGIW